MVCLTRNQYVVSKTARRLESCGAATSRATSHINRTSAQKVPKLFGIVVSQKFGKFTTLMSDRKLWPCDQSFPSSPSGANMPGLAVNERKNKTGLIVFGTMANLWASAYTLMARLAVEHSPTPN
jgi:hypothetical protein